MCKMEERPELSNGNGGTLHQHFALHQFPVIEQDGNFPEWHNESILAVANELAHAGDELTRRFSKNETKQDTLWENVKRYAFIVTFRLVFGLV